MKQLINTMRDNYTQILLDYNFKLLEELNIYVDDLCNVATLFIKGEDNTSKIEKLIKNEMMYVHHKNYVHHILGSNKSIYEDDNVYIIIN